MILKLTHGQTDVSADENLEEQAWDCSPDPQDPQMDVAIS